METKKAKRIKKGARKPGEPESLVCTRCGEEFPIEAFYVHRRVLINGEVRDYRTTVCSYCVYRQKKEREIQQEKLLNRQVTCKENCEFYPCFKGIDSLKSNLAVTCRQFKEKEI